MSGPEHALIGSVSEEVLLHANRTVLVVDGHPESESAKCGSSKHRDGAQANLERRMHRNPVPLLADTLEEHAKEALGWVSSVVARKARGTRRKREKCCGI
jgi:hypothetical protein